VLTHQERAERQIRRGTVGSQDAILAELIERDLLELCVASPPVDLDHIAYRYRFDRHALVSVVDRVRRLRVLGLPDAPAEPLWHGPLGLKAIEVYRIRDEDLPGELRERGT
jgi:hypothetical protein